MPRPPSLCDRQPPLSTAFDHNLESSLLSLDWVLTSGLRPNNSVLCGCLCLPYRDSADCVWSLDVQLTISASLPFDLVLGHDCVLNLECPSQASLGPATTPSIAWFDSDRGLASGASTSREMLPIRSRNPVTSVKIEAEGELTVAGRAAEDEEDEEDARLDDGAVEIPDEDEYVG
ncbi:hypothetical protein C8R44DRAFT_974533 [Mycena epipterygia]|nr:hypothetical protein C8R44DRAFT_974533 [Mycena epipterygia]